MTKAKYKRKRQLKNVGTATALTITLATSNIHTLAYADELETTINEVVVVEEMVNEEVNTQEEVAEVLETVETVEIIEEVVQEESIEITDIEVLQTKNISKPTTLDELKTCWTFTQYNDSKTIILEKYIGASFQVIVPAQIDGYKIKLRGKECFSNSDKKANITSIVFEAIGDSKVGSNVSLSDMFKDMISLKSIDLSGLDTSVVTNMSNLFAGCTALETINLSGANMSRINDISNVFAGISSLKNVDLSNVTLSTSVQDLSKVFTGCTALETVNLSGIDMSKITNVVNMFNGCNLNTLNLSGTNISNVINIIPMFNGCTNLNTLNLSGANLSGVTSVSKMFKDHPSLETIDLRGTKLLNIKDTSSMFEGCTALKNVYLDNLNIPLVTKIWNMFKGCTALETIDLSGLNTASVTDMTSLFLGCSNLTNVTLGGNFTTSKVIKFNNMFKDCTNLRYIDTSSLDTSSAEDMSYMFSDSGVKTLDLSNFNTQNVTTMKGMFRNTESLTNITFGDEFKTEKVTDMSFMFCNSGIESLNLKSFNTEKVTDMTAMFGSLDNINVLDLSNFKLNDAVDITSMFANHISVASDSNKIVEDNINFEKYKKGLLVISTDEKLSKYDYTADGCLPLNLTFHANGGQFKNGDITSSILLSKNVEQSVEAFIEVVNNFLGQPEQKPIRDGYNFISWEANQITRENSSILEKLNTDYYAKWEAITVTPPTTDDETPGVEVPPSNGDDNNSQDNTDEDVKLPIDDENKEDNNSNSSITNPGNGSSSNESTSNSQNNNNPQTGDVGVLGCVGLGLTSILGVFINNRKKKK